MDDLIEKINQKAAEIRYQKALDQTGKRNDVVCKLIKVKELAPRIKRLIDIANCLISNGFTLGYEHEKFGFTHYSLQTDGIDHYIGFVRLSSSVVAIGYKGGGCNGENFYVDASGQYVYDYDYHSGVARIVDVDYIHNYYRGDRKVPHYATSDFPRKLNKFLNEFDVFEARVLSYANSLTR